MSPGFVYLSCNIPKAVFFVLGVFRPVACPANRAVGHHLRYQAAAGSASGSNRAGVVNKLDEAIEREVRPWLDLIDSLRAQGIQDELSLPQVRESPGGWRE